MTLLKLGLSFAKVGLLGFGGGLSIVRLIYDSIQTFLPISREQFANIVAISQVTPGPLAVNVATFVGYVSSGVAGGIVATLGAILPAFIIVSIVCRMLKQFRNSTVVNGMIEGIRPATIGLICAAVVTIAKPSVAGKTKLGVYLIDKLGIQTKFLSNLPFDIISVLMVITTVVLMLKFKKSAFPILIAMGILGAFLGTA